MAIGKEPAPLKLTKREFAEHPTVQELMRQHEAATRQHETALAKLAQRYGIADRPQITSALSWSIKDSRPWFEDGRKSGKPRVPEMLVRMLVEQPNWATDFKTHRARHAAMVDEACKRAASVAGHQWSSHMTYSDTVWTKDLTSFALRNCLTVARDAGYRPNKATKRLDDFVKLVRAGKPGEQREAAGGRRFTKFGEHPHEIRFYSATEGSIGGRMFNAQWSSDKKVCEPINGTARIYFLDDPARKRCALRKYLVSHRVITAGQWGEVQKAAQDAKQMATVALLRGVVEAKQAEQRRGRRQVLEAEQEQLDASDLFDTADTGIQRDPG